MNVGILHKVDRQLLLGPLLPQQDHGRLRGRRAADPGLDRQPAVRRLLRARPAVRPRPAGRDRDRVPRRGEPRPRLRHHPEPAGRDRRQLDRAGAASTRCRIDFTGGATNSLPDTVDPARTGRTPTTTALGLRWTPSPTSQWRFGYVFDETPQPEEAVSPLLPDADRNGITIGYGYTGGLKADFAAHVPGLRRAHPQPELRRARSARSSAPTTPRAWLFGATAQLLTRRTTKESMKMHRLKTLASLLALALLAAGRPPLSRHRQADFTRYVAIGDSLTAGFSAAAWCAPPGNSYPALIYRQATGGDHRLRAAAGQPSPASRRHPRLRSLVARSGHRAQRRARGSPTNLTLPRPYNNLAVPGANVHDIVATTGGGSSDLRDLILRRRASPSCSRACRCSRPSSRSGSATTTPWARPPRASSSTA